MAKREQKKEGDHAMVWEKQKLTLSLTVVVAWLEKLCSGRN